MTEQEYNNFIEILSKFPISKIDAEPLEHYLNVDSRRAKAAISYKKNMIASCDNVWGENLLDLGLFMCYQFDNRTRLACICMCVEATNIRTRRNIELSCYKYDESMPLYTACKGLYSSVRDKELVDYHSINRIEKSHSFSYKHFYGKIDQRLPMSIIEWMDTIYNDKPLFVRLDPYLVNKDKPLEKIREAVVQAPDPTWWRNLRVYNGYHKGSSYELIDDPEDKDYYWNYSVLGIRRLEYQATRKMSDGGAYLSMLMEELELHEDKWYPDKTYLVGRMIHLDTSAEVGQEFSSAPLMHLDLAYNYYFDKKVEIRMNQDLAIGIKTEKASCRTHLMRIENISLSELFPIAFAFFKSTTMVYEWCNYQFMGAEFDARHRIKTAPKSDSSR